MHMDVRETEVSKSKYRTRLWVQVWFLKRSRECWKNKYKNLRGAIKGLRNQVNDVTRSREKWRGDAKELSRQIRELEAENAVLREQAAALKKGRQHACRFG